MKWEHKWAFSCGSGPNFSALMDNWRQLVWDVPHLRRRKAAAVCDCEEHLARCGPPIVNALCKYILPGLLVEWGHVMQVNHKLDALVNTRGIICTPPDGSCKVVVLFDLCYTGSRRRVLFMCSAVRGPTRVLQWTIWISCVADVLGISLFLGQRCKGNSHFLHVISQGRM